MLDERAVPEHEGSDESGGNVDEDDDDDDDPLGRLCPRCGEVGGGKTWNNDEDGDGEAVDDDGDDDDDARGAFFSILNLICAQLLLADGLPSDDVDGDGEGEDAVDIDGDDGGNNKVGFTADVDVEGVQDTWGLMSSCSVDNWLDAVITYKNKENKNNG